MKQFIIDTIGDSDDYTITVTFSNGDKIDFYQLYDDCPDTANAIDLVEAGTDYRHLINLDYVIHVCLKL